MNNTAHSRVPGEVTEEDQPVIFALISLSKSHQVTKTSRLSVLIKEKFPDVTDDQITRCLKLIGRRINQLEQA